VFRQTSLDSKGIASFLGDRNRRDLAQGQRQGVARLACERDSAALSDRDMANVAFVDLND